MATNENRDLQLSGQRPATRRRKQKRRAKPRKVASVFVESPRLFRTKDALYLIDKAASGFRVTKCDLTPLSSLPDSRARVTRDHGAGRYTFVASRLERAAGSLTAHGVVYLTGPEKSRVHLGKVLSETSPPEPRAPKTVASELPKVEDPVSVTTPVANPLDWEVLPAGWWRQGGWKGLTAARTATEVAAWHEERLALLDSLGPKSWYSGSHLGERLYFVAVFPHLAIADSGDFGNALYYVYGEDNKWKSVFRLSKREAMSLGAKRIIHTGLWQNRVRTLVRTAGRRSLL